MELVLDFKLSLLLIKESESGIVKGYETQRSLPSEYAEKIENNHSIIDIIKPITKK